jgi:outer membrane protein assembly factor BamB
VKKAVLILSLCLLTVPCQAEIIIVDDDGPADFDNIQAAIDDSNDGDIIYVFPGIYAGPGNHDIDFAGRAITVTSVAPHDPYIVAATVIDCNGSAAQPRFAFCFHNTEDANSILNGLTVTSAYGNGGIWGSGAAPTIKNCIIINNTALSGGGGIRGCNGVITNCIIIGNSTAVGSGGGLATCNGPVVNCVIAQNTTAGSGGALYDCDGLITNCTIADNTAARDGGGLFRCSASITNCIVWGNQPNQLVSSSQPHYSCIEGISGAYDNINLFPGFVDPNSGDYHLLWGSPCIDAGDPNFVADTNQVDIDAQPRIINSRVDIGADEFGNMVVLRPVAAEVWVAGSRREVQWFSGHCGTVDILLSVDGGTNWETIEASITDTGSRKAHLPDAADSNQCVVKVVANTPDCRMVGVDSELFTIHMDAAGPAVVSPWKSLGGDSHRAGLSEHSGPELGCVKWQFEVDRAISASVTVGPNETVYVPCEDGNLYKLDANGTLLWEFEANSPLLSAASLGPDATAYVGAKNGWLYAVDVDGNVRWTHVAQAPIYSSPAVSVDGNSVYISSENGKVYALGRDGSNLWAFQTDGLGLIGGAIYSSPAIGVDGTVYVSGFYDPNLYALDPNDGSVKWVCNFASGGWPFASPVVGQDGTIYQTLLYDPNLYAIDPNDGMVIWSANVADIASGLFEPHAFDSVAYDANEDRCVYVRPDYNNLSDSGFFTPALGPQGTVYASLDDGFLRAVNPNGTVKWVAKTGSGRGFDLAVGADGLIYAGSDDGSLYVVNPDGAMAARFDSNDHWLGFPAIAGENAVLLSDSRENSMLISYARNKVWAISGSGCEGEKELRWVGAEDLNQDGLVHFADVGRLADDWLECTDCRNSACSWFEMFVTGDINRDYHVNFLDYAALAERWLNGY